MVGGSGSNASGRAHLGGVESLRAYAAFAIVILLPAARLLFRRRVAHKKDVETVDEVPSR